MADEIVYKKVTRKADKGLEGKVVAKHGKQTNQKPKKLVDVLFVVVQGSFPNLLSLFQGKKLIGNFCKSSVIADHFHSQTLHLTICQNRRLRSIF